MRTRNYAELRETGEHLPALVRAIKSRKSHLEPVRIVSPWVSAKPVKILLENLPNDGLLEVVFRWPARNDGAAAIDIQALEILLEDERVALTWLSPDEHLHSKVYLVPGQLAIISSANLTNRGFPIGSVPTKFNKGRLHDGAPQNTELGVTFTRKSMLANIEKWITDLNTYDLTREQLSQLEAWTKDWRSKAKLLPQSPQPPMAAKNTYEEALNLAQGNGWIRSWKHALHRKHNAFLLELNNKKSQYAVRIRTSISLPNKPFHYHFHLTPYDLEMWERSIGTQQPGIKGLVLVPTVNKAGEEVLDPDLAPMVFVPMASLFQRNRLTRKIVRRGSKNEREIGLNLVKNEETWELQIASYRGRTIPLDGCLNRTTEFKKPEGSRKLRSQRRGRR